MTMMLDTRAVAPADRTEYWSTGIAEHFFPMRVESFAEGQFGDVPFEARLSGGEIGPVAARSISGLPHRVARTPRMIAHSDPESILLYLVRRGSCRIDQDGRSCELRAGDVACHDTSLPSSFEAPAGFDVLVLSFPKWFLGRTADTISSRTATRVAGADTPLLRLAAPLLSSFVRTAAEGLLIGSEAEAAAEMMLPLIRGLHLAHDADASYMSSALLQTRMRQYALAHLHNPTLGPEQIAQAHYVSKRYVHKLFAPSGGVSAWIREQRLQRAAEELRATTLPVSEIAGRWGYQDAASFSRAFRKALGRSPREERVAG